MTRLNVLAYLFILIILFSSCDKNKSDDIISETHEIESTIRSSNKTWEQITWSELQNDLQFYEIIEGLNLNLISELGQTNPILTDTSTISKCSDVINDYYSFTFPVVTDQSYPDIIKNLLLDKRGKRYTSKIVEY